MSWCYLKKKYLCPWIQFPIDLSYFPYWFSLSPDDCAAILLACLYCRFHDLVVMLPDTCERAVSRCFPSFKYIKASSEKDQRGGDCCSCNLSLDCGFCSSCQDAADLLELAMEVSEICYHWGVMFPPYSSALTCSIQTSVISDQMSCHKHHN